MDIQTNDFEVAKLQLAWMLCQQVESIENKGITAIRTDMAALKRAKLVAKIFSELPTST